MNIDKNGLGNKIKKLRQEKSLSQRELAQNLLKTQQAIDAWERGVAIPSTTMLFTLADFFSVSVDYLLGRTYIKTLADKVDINELSEMGLSEETKSKIKLLLLNDKMSRVNPDSKIK